MTKRLFGLLLLLISISVFAERSDIVTLYGNGTNANTPVFRINQSGSLFEALLNSTNVGIGTSNPTRQLEIYRSGGASPALRFNDSAHTWDLRTNGTFSNVFQIDYDTNHKLLIDTAGNVGIATTTPTEKLEVNGNTKLDGNLYIKGPRPWVDIMTYGAKCDNATDDTTAIQNALNTGYDVFIPYGICKITDIVSAEFSGQTIFGTGKNSILKLYNNVDNPYGVTASGLENVTFHDFTIDESSSTVPHGARGAINFGPNGTVKAKYCIVERVNVIYAQGTGIAVDQCEGCVVRDNYIYRCWEHGIYAVSGPGTIISGNVIIQSSYGSGQNPAPCDGTTSNEAMKLELQNSIISGNYIREPCGHGVEIEAPITLADRPFGGNVFEGNTVIGSTSFATTLFNIGQTGVPTAFGIVAHNFFQAWLPATLMTLNAATTNTMYIVGNEFNTGQGAAIGTLGSYALTNSIISGNIFRGGAGTTVVNIASGTNNTISGNTFLDFTGGQGIYLSTNTSYTKTEGNLFSNYGAGQTILDAGGVGNNMTFPTSHTSSEIATLIPGTKGAFIYNSTLNGFCQSTGTVAGAWGLVKSTGTGCQ